MGVIQRRRAAVSVSTLRNMSNVSFEKKTKYSRFCDHYMVGLQNARRLSAGLNLKEVESAVEKKRVKAS